MLLNFEILCLANLFKKFAYFNRKMNKTITITFLAVAFIWAFTGTAYCQKTVNDWLFTKQFSYATISPLQKELFDDFVDEEFPPEADVKDILNQKASVRNKMRLAEALFFRNRKDDVLNAINIISWIISLQDTVTTHKSFGNWKGGVNDKEYDENMREFIGTDLIIVYHKYKNSLPDALKKKLESSLIIAAKGDYVRNVKADYNNIAIMSSFLQDYVGHTFNLPVIQKAGLNKAKEILSHFEQYGTLCEYNSPTYYGVDFTGLALWREIAISPEFKEMGKILEKKLWIDVASFYNANLQNICGPYLRSYGIDMKKYTAVVGVWIAAAVNNVIVATVPAKNGPHNESNFIVSIFDLGISMPRQALNEFTQFGSPRFLSRTTPNYYEGDKLKKVTAYIQTNWMMGGLWGNRKVSHILKTGTIHWNSTTGDIGWLYVPGEGKTNVRVDEKQMSIYLADPEAKDFEIILYGLNSSITDIAETNWKLSPMEMDIKSILHRKSIMLMSRDSIRDNIESDVYYPYAYKVVYEIPAGWNAGTPLVTITPKYSK
jgi:hypothetical protein